MNSTLGASPSTSRMGSLASIGQPMAVQRSDPNSGTVYIDKSETATVQVHTLPGRTWTDTQPTAAGLVRYQESRHAMTPTVAGPQTVNSNVWMEDMQPTYSTKSYETIRRDPASLFPGANIVSVGTPGVVQTALGSVYNPRDNTFYSRLTNQTTFVEPLASNMVSSTLNYTTGNTFPIPPAASSTYQSQTTTTTQKPLNIPGSLYGMQPTSNWMRP